MPVSFNVVKLEHISISEDEEKEMQVLQVDEKEIEEELAQIKKNAEAVNAHVSHSRPGFLFDPLEEVPTLAHQDQFDKKASTELNFEYPESLNDSWIAIPW